MALNLGYACLNCHLREQKLSIYTNRTCIKKTFDEKGLDYVCKLAYQNVKDLKEIIKWNHENYINFFRMSSKLFPWCTQYDLEDLPNFEEIKDLLENIGELAREYKQRLTFHPEHFCILPSLNENVVKSTIHTLEIHSKIFDIMGYNPSPENKINIHIGSTRNGDKKNAIKFFAENFKKLSGNVKARLTIENDDKKNGYSVDDLYPLAIDLGIPIVFDLHHQRFCKGIWSDREALEKALSTWPTNVRPVVHWSESQKDRIPSAHSDYVGLTDEFNLYGYDTSKVDIMIEAKMKECALLKYRDELAPMYEVQKKQISSKLNSI